MVFRNAELEAIRKASNTFKGLAADIDGTLHGGPYDWTHIQASLLSVVRAGKPVAIVTGRGVSLEANLLPVLGDLPVTLATANGSRMVQYDGKSPTPNVIYSHELLIDEVRAVVETYEEFCADNGHAPTSMISPDADKLAALLPDPFVTVSHQHNGVWAEPTKVCLEMPRSLFGTLDVDLARLLGPSVNVYRGSETIVDVTRAQITDGKKAAVTRFADLHQIHPDSIVCLGDSPHGNDSGLLSGPLSFTNNGAAYEEYCLSESHPNLKVIGCCSQDPVGAMHDLIAHLIA
jgi:hydroxymethylpyrimidine pyrophosphatase-like HAD family hydrolase